MFVGITTTGDVDPRALTEIGGTGVFAGAVRDAVRTGAVDVAVHSLKDLPTAPDDDLEVAAVPAREDTRDVLVGRYGWPTCGTGSGSAPGPRGGRCSCTTTPSGPGSRIDVVPIRGNVDTRLRLVREGQVDAVVLAAAGLIRLGHLRLAGFRRRRRIRNRHGGGSTSTDPGLRGHASSPWTGRAGAGNFTISQIAAPRTAIRALDDHRARAESLVERGFLAALEAGCTAPVGARSRLARASRRSNSI